MLNFLSPNLFCPCLSVSIPALCQKCVWAFIILSPGHSKTVTVDVKMWITNTVAMVKYVILWKEMLHSTEPTVL